MSRGPPPSLTADDILALAEVRRDIWTNGLIGFFSGGFSGYLLHRGAVLARDRKLVSIQGLNRNTAFASVMLGAAFGSFLLSTTAGKNSVHTLHPLFERGAQPLAVPNTDDDGGETDSRNYQKTMAQSRLELERNRIMRRASLSQKMKEGHGLSDSHGGHWVMEEKFQNRLERNRTMRRASLGRNLTEGHGLSDSHGGRWVEDKFQKE